MVCKCWIPFSSFFPGPQTGSKERPSSLKGPCQGPAFLPISPSSSKASCPNTGSLSPAASFPRLYLHNCAEQPVSDGNMM